MIFYIGFRGYFGSLCFCSIPALENIAVSANRGKGTVGFSEFFDKGRFGRLCPVAVKFYSNLVALPSCIECVVFGRGNKAFGSDL